MHRNDTLNERQSKYLAHLMKMLAEHYGYRAEIDTMMAHGCKVDVVLEYSGKQLACRVFITRDIDYELSNVRSYLTSGFDGVIFCSTEKKT